MEKNEKTKYKLAEAMKECMKTSKVDAITVKQLAEKKWSDQTDLLSQFSG